jgi:hypothetical protein
MHRFLIIVAILITWNLSAQDNNEYKTIFKGHDKGGYGALSAGYSEIDSAHALVFNARGGIILWRSVSFGLGGSGFVSQYRQHSYLNKNASLIGGYGGAYLEFIILGSSPVHLSIPVFFGFGGASYTTWENEGTDYEPLNYIEDIASFLVFEPSVELEFNLSKFFRMAVYYSMRYTSGLDISTSNTSGASVPLVSPDALNNYSLGIIFKFGKF